MSTASEIQTMLDEIHRIESSTVGIMGRSSELKNSHQHNVTAAQKRRRMTIQ